MSEKLVEGQEVRVFTATGINRRANETPGKITKVGRKLVTIEYGDPGSRRKTTDQFRIETGRVNDNYGREYFLTLEQAEEKARRKAALAVLEEHEIEAGRGRRGGRLTTEQIEQLAAVVKSWRK
jgi:hypothetical protein